MSANSDQSHMHNPNPDANLNPVPSFAAGPNP
jgi:hypothetical protein